MINIGKLRQMIRQGFWETGKGEMKEEWAVIEAGEDEWGNHEEGSE